MEKEKKHTPVQTQADVHVTEVDHVVHDHDCDCDSNCHCDHDYHRHHGRLVGNNISWSAILAGLVTFIALSILFSLIGAAIGLGVTDLTAAKPLEGVGMGLIIWSIISLIISLAAGGYVAGYTANRAGILHGFLTWAVGVIAALVLATSAVTGAFNTVGAMLGMAGNAVADTATTIGESVADLSQASFDKITENLNLDTSDLDEDVKKALEQSDIPELQPDYLQAQLDDTVSDIQAAGKSVLVDGQSAEEAFQGVYDNIQDRLDNIGQELDEEELTKVIADNTDLTDKEADQAVENVKAAYEESRKNAETLLDNAEKELNQLSAQVNEGVEEGIETTNDVMNEASKYSIYAFIGLLLALCLTAYAGKFGAEKDLKY